MRYYLAVLFALLAFAIPWLFFGNANVWEEFRRTFSQAEWDIAAVLMHRPKTVSQVKSSYEGAVLPVPTKKVRILIVPGHEPEFGGAEYGNILERKLVVELSNKLKEYLSKNPRYEVYITRNDKSWDPIFENYFKTNWEEIDAWQKLYKAERDKLIGLGKFQPVTPTVLHNNAPINVARRLFGISKWVNENDVDIAIHVHLNDYPGHGRNTPGDYSGFSIYVPEKQYFNSELTQALASKIYGRLEKYSPVSDFPGEKGGIIEDQDLIAVGSFNTVDAASMLLEYGYIYEPQFTDETLRAKALDDLALQTYLGIQDFFDVTNVLKSGPSADTVFLPHKWGEEIRDGLTPPVDVFALQTALILEGVYPPDNKSKNDCPRSGKIGVCTKAALGQFLKKHNISNDPETAGKAAAGMMNKLYSGVI